MRPFGALQAALAAPALLLLVLVIALPSVYVLWLSFTESSYGRDPVFIGLANYEAIWRDRFFWRALINTLVIVNVVVYAELVLAFLIAHVFAQGMPLRSMTMAVLLTPYAISEVVAVVMWKFLVDPEYGALTRPLLEMGLSELRWAIDPTHGIVLICIICIWLHLPFTTVIIYAAMLAVPKHMLEAAAVDGASGWQTMRHVVIPAVMPAIMIALIFRYIISFRIFTEVWLLTGGGPARMTEVMAVYLYKQAFTYTNFGQGAAMAWIMVLVSGAIAAIYMRRLYGRTPSVYA